MLREIRSDVLRVGSITFEPGLNVVLGDDNATNSIGKSTLLMIVDFALGGEALLSHNADLVAELGHHDYSFVFVFGEGTYRFRRGTSEPTIVYICDADFHPLRGMDLEEYRSRLKTAYGITVKDLSFRALVGLYLRIWGKENLAVERPLHTALSQRSRDCVNTLIKTFERYEGIRDLADQLDRTDAEAKALGSAARHEIISSITRSTYKSNVRRIEDLEKKIEEIREDISIHAINLSAIVNDEVLQLKRRKNQLLTSRLTVASRLDRVRQNLHENRSITSHTFKDLVNFFPEVKQERLVKVEEFHNGVARLLRVELQRSERELEKQLLLIDAAVGEIDAQTAQALRSVDKPAHLVDVVVDTAVALHEARESNRRYERETELKGMIKRLRDRLASEKGEVLYAVQEAVNDGMRDIVNSVFGNDRKSPRITLRERNYSFQVHEDTGTGTAYASLVIFDLTVFLATQLPVIAHDSLLFKNIENSSVAKLLQIYLRTNKQSFIAIDEIEKYGKEAASILRDHSVIQLDDQNVLYVKDWRRKNSA